MILLNHRMLDPSLRVPYPLSLFVRAKAIIVNFESIRMIITHNKVSARAALSPAIRLRQQRCSVRAANATVVARPMKHTYDLSGRRRRLPLQAFVLSVPVPGQSLLAGSPAKPQAPFVKHLVRRVRPHGNNDGPEHDRCALAHDRREDSPSLHSPAVTNRHRKLRNPAGQVPKVAPSQRIDAPRKQLHTWRPLNAQHGAAAALRHGPAVRAAVPGGGAGRRAVRHGH